MNKLIAITGLLLLPSCSWVLGTPRIESKDMPTIVKAITQSSANICVWLGGRGGGGALPALPAVGGGYGSGELLIGRVNSAGVALSITNGTCTITSHPAPAGDFPGPVDQEADGPIDQPPGGELPVYEQPVKHDSASRNQPEHIEVLEVPPTPSMNVQQLDPNFLEGQQKLRAPQATIP